MDRRYREGNREVTEIIVTPGGPYDPRYWDAETLIKVPTTGEVFRVNSMPVQLPDGTWRCDVEHSPFKTTP